MATKQLKRKTGGTRGVVPPRPLGPIEPDTVYDPEEAAGYLRCTMRTLRTLVESGKLDYLPHNKRQRRYQGRDLLAYIDRERRRATR
jgi:hypothetical protein